MSTSLRMDAEVLADAAAVRAQHADRVGLVDVQERLVAFLDFDEPRQVGDVAVHAVHAFDRDQHAAIGRPQLGQQLVERLPIVVRKRPPAGAREDRALDDAVVRQRVVQDQVAGAEQVADRGFVRGVAADDRRWPRRRRGSAAIACSSSRWIVFSPDTRRLAETLVP